MPSVMPAIRVSRPPRLLFNTFGNECARIIESKSWSASSLGQIDDWPAALHITLGIVLNSRFPMFLFWGKENLCFYNDAAKLFIHGKHPFALGKKAEIIFAEFWHILKPRIDRVLHYGETTWIEEQAIPMFSQPEGDYVATFSYSPVYNERGCREGVLVTGLETEVPIRMSTENRLKGSRSVRRRGASIPLA